MALVKYNNNSISAVTAAASIPSGTMNLITTNTITSGVSSSSFTSNIDSTYDTYIFKLINIHPQTDGADFTFNFSIDSGSNYNVTKTSTIFQSYQSEGGANPTLNYDSSRDLAQSTAYQVIMQDPGNDDDQSGSGTIYLFSPSDTTFVKHFISDTNEYQGSDYTVRKFLAGYCNTTSAIDAVDFKFASGNIDSGTIIMYGVS
jgi:hypothetical protein